MPNFKKFQSRMLIYLTFKIPSEKYLANIENLDYKVGAEGPVSDFKKISKRSTTFTTTEYERVQRGNRVLTSPLLNHVMRR